MAVASAVSEESFETFQASDQAQNFRRFKTPGLFVSSLLSGIVDHVTNDLFEAALVNKSQSSG
ncbi:MAG: hypothetical protein WBG54_01710 [Acidobacteriaceae bacterium]